MCFNLKQMVYSLWILVLLTCKMRMSIKISTRQGLPVMAAWGVWWLLFTEKQIQNWAKLPQTVWALEIDQRKITNWEVLILRKTARASGKKCGHLQHSCMWPPVPVHLARTRVWKTSSFAAREANSVWGSLGSENLYLSIKIDELGRKQIGTTYIVFASVRLWCLWDENI